MMVEKRRHRRHFYQFAAIGLYSMLTMWQTKSTQNFFTTTNPAAAHFPYPYHSSAPRGTAVTRHHYLKLPLAATTRDGNNEDSVSSDPPGPRSWPLVGNMLSAAKEGSLPGQVCHAVK